MTLFFYFILHIFELSVPIEANGNIDKRHREKSDKYAHFVTDITGYNCQVTCFEIGSRGYISSRNHSSLYTLHKFTKPGIQLPKFKENILALSVYSSYHIFITRKEELFVEPPYLLPPFEDNWSIWTKQHYEQYYVVETNCVQPCLKSILFKF